MDSPTFVRFQLGAQLRRLREEAKISTEQAAAAIEVTASTLRRIEQGKVGIKGPSLTALLDKYNVDDVELRDTLLSMAREGKARGWWAKYSDLPQVYRQYIGLESAAEEIQDFQTIVVPGLLQTEAYARAMTSSGARKPTPEAVQQNVTVRMERQKLVTEGKLRLVAVMDEAVLHRQIGGAEVMREQLTAMLELAKLRNVTLQVIPFKEGAYASMLSSFAILTLPAGPNVVYIEGLTGDLYAEGDEVQRCVTVLNELRASALSPSASLEMIKQIRETDHQQ
ncbi:transcriptional regulator with XRE-family HTH domain [Actinoplanes octamycinicus]|uniref:Transcriptional regulator with XRE-family HTH domain n=1 Tax=Actinoplanes octamycinicus TaxID=135948 RepID=A0A7W7GU18_9ACTN|nr:helix-turn-helix transcriptional regulator [Actinoplanes octamycinicus]MBB4738294.1 transcriptional regulator with XRE-family HTH domain [Actinoplanes octamycinicus]GIE57412.1 transcriptional regulator [Actinoplanes octamycinicus]